MSLINSQEKTQILSDLNKYLNDNTPDGCCLVINFIQRPDGWNSRIIPLHLYKRLHKKNSIEGSIKSKERLINRLGGQVNNLKEKLEPIDFDQEKQITGEPVIIMMPDELLKKDLEIKKQDTELKELNKKLEQLEKELRLTIISNVMQEVKQTSILSSAPSHIEEPKKPGYDKPTATVKSKNIGDQDDQIKLLNSLESVHAEYSKKYDVPIVDMTQAVKGYYAGISVNKRNNGKLSKFVDHLTKIACSMNKKQDIFIRSSITGLAPIHAIELLLETISNILITKDIID
jgi:hypothetical protein